MSKQAKYTMSGEFTSACTCMVEDEQGQDAPATECLGWCWEDALEFFLEHTKHYFSKPQAYYIHGFPTWQGPRNGEIYAKNANDFIRRYLGGCGTDYRVKWSVTYRTLHLHTSHHDASGVVTVTKGKK